MTSSSEVHLKTADNAQQKRPSKVTIINAYSVHNLGDAGIVIATANILRDLYPEIVISVMSSSFLGNAGFYEARNIRSVPAVWELKGSMVKRYLRGAYLAFATYLGAKVEASDPITQSDLIISAGGGYLYSSRRGPLGAGFLAALFHIWFSKKAGKKVIVGPKSFGPITSSYDRSVMQRCLRNVDRIIAREQVSASYLESLKLERCVLAPDIAFALEPKFDPSHYETAQGSPKIGITVLDWRFARANSTEADIDNYLNAINDACTKVTRQFPSAHFYVFPQVSASNQLIGDCDIAISERLAKLIGSRATMIDISKTSDPQLVIGVYSDMDCFLGSRMHSAIFALCGGVPTIALAYQSKTKGTFELLGLGKNVLDVANVDPAALSDMILSTLARGEDAKNEVRSIVKTAHDDSIAAMRNAILDVVGDVRLREFNASDKVEQRA